MCVTVAPGGGLATPLQIKYNNNSEDEKRNPAGYYTSV
jgi:hypothetical protein